MNLKQDRIKEIVDNGYALDFADVFNKAFEKKNSALCGLMIFVFMVILILIIVSVISFLGLGALSQESMKSCPSIWKILAVSTSLTTRGIHSPS
jgi:hypothetical protein